MSRYPDGVLETRGRGRPRVEEPLERVSTRLPVPVYDQLVRVANAQETSVADVMRQIVIVGLPHAE